MSAQINIENMRTNQVLIGNVMREFLLYDDIMMMKTVYVWAITVRSRV